jgi:hypothetical protein
MIFLYGECFIKIPYKNKSFLPTAYNKSVSGTAYILHVKGEVPGYLS